LEAVNAFEEREQRRRSKSLLSYDEKRNESAIDKMTLTQLKSICKGKGLKVSGKKADLQERLRLYYSIPSSSSEDQIRLQNNENPVSDSEDHIRLENNGIPVSKHDEFDTMTDEDLRDACVARNINSQGTRETMLHDLRKDIHFQQKIWELTPDLQSQDGYEKIGKILARAADSDEQLAAVLKELDEKKKATAKYIDVKIKSIGMAPEKFTSGGSPSVTANVLWELAGDPFSDPPKYGKAYKFFKTHQEGYVLQSRVEEQSRVHCSLNFNTESSPKNNLIVADYGQLELRLLASVPTLL
jgi:hypothetical protein